METFEEPPSVCVVRAVAADHGVDVAALPPLSEVTDTDALDTLFTDAAQTAPDGSTDAPVARFRYADRLVVVRGDGTVDVRAPE
ncbi:HalOD1 output domain-containing protein [Haloarcula litorea]|uniref:HalOD1 output domain-containing protein n=1 Tax=Haloarcula litorea TaxID=3032579 RepID=UPI0023E80407|nr:HalOD1 output domain-containing protein [Halomicroarcula sp. GDY20]